MNISHLRKLGTVAGLLLLTSTFSPETGPLQESCGLAAVASESLLFDGHSLAGWEDPAGETPPGRAWDVKDGCIHATPHPCLREDLYTLETFSNFELAFEWKIAPAETAGSSISFRIASCS